MFTAVDPTAPTSETELRTLARILRTHGTHAVEALRIAMARQDIGAFAEVLLRDEETGARVRQAPLHDAWHRELDEHDRAVIWSHVEAGKTTQVSILRTIYELGHDPSLRFAIVSNTAGQAEKIVRTVGKYIAESPDLPRVFPALRPALPWTSTALFVDRPTKAKDPSVQGVGIHGALLGARLDRIILDDVLDYENTRTPGQRQALIEWIEATLMGRLTRRGRVYIVGTAFHPQDALHYFGAKPGWKASRWPVVEPSTGEPRWPERWPAERIAKKRLDLGPIEFARQLLCQARSDDDARFKLEWLRGCLARGEGKSPTYALQALPNGYRTFTGVDLAVQQHSAADLTVFFTVVVHPDSTREVLSVESGRYTGPEIVAKLHELHGRYFSTLVVENNAAQDFIRQFAGKALPIIPFTTGRNKAHPEFGVESLAAELARSQWIIPCQRNANGALVTDAEISKWVDEMLYYQPNAHTGDRLMASWFAREGVRKEKAPGRAFRQNLLAR